MTAAARRAILALADGTIFEGSAFGAEAEVAGELVENTAATGYQELLSDPASSGRIVVFAWPELGNVGVNDGDLESARPTAAGVVARNVAIAPSSHLAERSLPDWMESDGVPGIFGIDTRMLVRHLRRSPATNAVLSTVRDADPAALVAKARAVPPPGTVDRVAQVTTPTPYGAGAATARHHVVAYDFGIKRSALRQLEARGCRVTVLPAATPAAEALALRPDGLFLSSGPEGAASAAAAAGIVRELLGKAPILATHFGCQVLAMAAGATTRLLPAGHNGTNHPVREMSTGRVLFTSQSHEWAVDEASLEGTGAIVTHTSVHDGSIEGFSLPAHRALGVQFHPEASPGPHDALGVFDRFVESMGAH
ncbi:MAG TPA: carbamoyl phosphate synthase small subunit [Vulgatibacter sp.]